MEKKAISEIMEKYAAGELTMEEINEKLKEVGAGYHLEPMTEEETRAKREREDREGLLDIGRGGEKPLRNTPDMCRRRDLAGQVVVQRVRSGYFAVFYDEDGYAVKARRVTFADRGRNCEQVYR